MLPDFVIAQIIEREKNKENVEQPRLYIEYSETRPPEEVLKEEIERGLLILDIL